MSPEQPPAPDGHAILVGHDGSTGADRALVVALQLASEIGAPLVILRAWSMTSAPQPPSWTFGYASSTDEIELAVRAALESEVRALRHRFPDVEVTCRADHEGPAQSLIAASHRARMLVVGSRGLGGLRELVLGSVSEQCVRRARCPVLVVRGPGEAEPPGEVRGRRAAGSAPEGRSSSAGQAA